MIFYPVLFTFMDRCFSYLFTEGLRHAWKEIHCCFCNKNYLYFFYLKRMIKYHLLLSVLSEILSNKIFESLKKVLPKFNYDCNS